MSTINVLKITCGSNIMLLSTNATQNIAPVSEYKVIRNIDNKVIEQPTVRQLFKYNIKTTDAPNVEYLRIGTIYTIYSTVEFYSSSMPSTEYVPNSLVKTDTGYTYSPILNAILTNFECNTNNNIPTWTMTFEHSVSELKEFESKASEP